MVNILSDIFSVNCCLNLIHTPNFRQIQFSVVGAVSDGPCQSFPLFPDEWSVAGPWGRR